MGEDAEGLRYQHDYQLSPNEFRRRAIKRYFDEYPVCDWD